jgi:methionyl-tRNA formyltransferase
MKIVFMGTPEFAVPSLDILLKNGYDIVGVVTATDKWGGRGNKTLLQSAVKQYALEHGLPVLQPEKLRAPDFLEALRALGADLQVVVAFRMLPEVVWAMPPLGTINLHGSLLPKYRGAAPINWAIINGERETGVSTFFLQHEIDTGDLLLQTAMPIGSNETAGELHDRMMHVGAATLLASVRAIEKGDFAAMRQPTEQATKAPKLFEENCQLRFDQGVARAHDFVRGLSPYPAAWTLFNGVKLKIFKARPEHMTHSDLVGSFLTDGKRGLKVACNDGYLHLLEVQLQGRKRMDVASFLNGQVL